MKPTDDSSTNSQLPDGPSVQIPDPPPPEPHNPPPSDEDGIWARISLEKKRLETGYLELGRDLYVIFATEKYKDRGSNTFDEWCREEGIEPGKARRLRRVFKVFQRDLRIPIDRVKKVGYTNAVTILPVIKAHNVDDWLDKAEKLSYRDLKKLVDEVRPRRRKPIVSPPGSQPQSYTPEPASKLAASLVDAKHQPSRDGMAGIEPEEPVYEKTFYLVGDQVRVLETTLELMERRTGSSRMGYLLSCALLEFLAKTASADAKDDGQIAYFMALLEQRYGGRVMWIKDKRVAERLNELLKQAEGSESSPP